MPLAAVTVHWVAPEAGTMKPAIALSRPLVLSQASPSAASEGTQILFNGRTLPAVWSQWQIAGSTRTGISDAGLMQALGVELLNTEDASHQPVQWFSDPRINPLLLPTRLIGSIRYLDITDFARQMGWQMQVNGTTLQIASAIARVQSVRLGKQSWGDRIVIELDQPATWQVDQQNQEFVLTLNAQLDPSLLSPQTNPTTTPITRSPGSQLAFLLSQPAPNQTQLRLSIPLSLRPRVWSLPNPNRLIVDVRPDSLVERNIVWAPGLRWRSQILDLGGNRFPVVWLAVNPLQPGIRLKPILPNPGTMTGIASLPQTVRLAQAAAAINGGFFNRNNQLPLGAIRLDGRWLSGPILNRGAIAWNSSGAFKIDRLALQETLITSTGQRLPLTHLNSGYIQAGIARYTSDWGPTYTPLSDNEILVLVQNNRIINQQTIPTAGSQPIPIPANGYLLVLRSNRTAATSLAVGSSLRLESVTNPPDFSSYPQIVAAGPLLLQNRQIVLDAPAEKFSRAFATEKASRSAIGQAANGHLLIAAVHTDIRGVGATLTDIAQIMQQLGAINALNLDGGSSTTLYLGGQILDRPPRTVARVHNGIGIFVQPTRQLMRSEE
ncbi:phosphodiester glycosidase family protein [Leptothermofonsia sp. ETS-13]|uniref:phosphodiester glycosidase family protein n=1 Tax=Leptothermofonsia sp. ETS-13 TaxID=3035696 RepID=UPI003BA15FBC